jgi:hypothetical protein
MAEQNDQKDNSNVSLLQQALKDEQKRSKQLEEDNRALITEFNQADTYEDQLEIAKDAIAEILPMAISTTKSLIANGTDSVRASLSRYVMETVLSGKLQQSSDKTVAGLLQALAENGENIPAKVAESKTFTSESD